MPRSHQSTDRTHTVAEAMEAQLPPLGGLPARLSLPAGYEPRYPYPLMVMFHHRGSNDENVQRLVPHLSKRNYICLSLRGPETVGRRRDGSPACGWGGGQYDSLIEDSLLRSVEWVCRAYHVHTERIYLAGICEGAAQAYRLGLANPNAFGGIIALNGEMPAVASCGPIFRMSDVRDFRVLIGHGIANAQVPLATAKRSFRALYAAGAEVRLLTYPTTHRLHARMLRDVNRWVIEKINSEHDALVID